MKPFPTRLPPLNNLFVEYIKIQYFATLYLTFPSGNGRQSSYFLFLSLFFLEVCRPPSSTGKYERRLADTHTYQKNWD